LGHKKLAEYGLAILVIVIVSASFTPVFAAKYVEHTDSLDVRKDVLEQMFQDVTVFASIFSDNITVLETSYQVDKKTVKMQIDIAGLCNFTTDFEYTKQEATHVVDFVSGKLENSKLAILLESRSSYDGTVDGGTIAYMSLYIDDVPCIPDMFVSDRDMKYILDHGLDELEKKAIALQKEIDAQKLEEPPISTTVENTVQEPPEPEPPYVQPSTDSEITEPPLQERVELAKQRYVEQQELMKKVAFYYSNYNNARSR